MKVKKNFSSMDGTGTLKKALPTHEEKLLEMLTKESDQDVVNKGEFRRLLVEGSVTEDNESVNGTEDQPELNYEGIFDKENPRVYDEDGDELMCLESEKNRDSILKSLGNSEH